MAAAQLMLPANRAFNSNGLAVPRAVAYLYTTGTTTPQPFYSDSGLTVSLGSSITANGAGRFPTAYQDNATPFRLRIEDSEGAELEDIDPFYFGQTAVTVNSTSVTPQMFGAAADATDAGVGTDDTAAIQAAIEHLVSLGGGELYFPTGNYKCASSLDLANHHNIVFTGPSGSGAGYSQPPPAQLIYTGTGTRFIDMRGTYGMEIRNLGVRYTSASFAGELIDGAFLGYDTSYLKVERCLLYGKDVATARSMINLEGAILCSVVDNHIGWGQVGVRGRKYVGPGNYLYSNAHSFERNTFDNLTVAAMLNPGEGWSVVGNWFEGTDGGSGGMPYALFDNLAAGGACGGLTWIGNWHGDATNVDITWITTGATTLTGAVFQGNFFQTYDAATIPAIKLAAQCNGVSITGNLISSYIDLGSTAHYGVSITGNYYYNEVANIASGCRDLMISGNKVNGTFAKTYFRFSSIQDWAVGGESSPTGPGVYRFMAPTATSMSYQLFSDSGQYNCHEYWTDGVKRFIFGVDNSNNPTLICYDNSAAYVGPALTVNRLTLGVTFGGAISATNLSGTNTGDQFGSTTASKLIGRGSASGAGAAQEITLGTGLSMSGTTLNATGSSMDGAKIRKSATLTAQDLTTEAAVTWNSEDWDTGSYHDTGSNTDRMTVTNAGYYGCIGQVVLVNLTAGQWVLCRIQRYNSSNVVQETLCGSISSNPGTTSIRLNCSGEANMAAGDYLKLSIQVQSDTSVDITTDSFLSIRRIG